MGKLVKNGISYTGGSGASSYNELTDKPQINGVTLSGNKTPDALGLVTKAVNDLVNYYLKTETYSKTEVDTIVSNIKNSRFEVVASLPTSDIKTNVIYLVPKADAESGDIKDEYINLDGTTAGWEKIGSTEVDLSNYVSVDDLNTALADYTTTTDLTALLANKQDKLQYSTLPTASAELEGKIFEYTGATGNGLTHGYFYECVSDGESTPTYSWQQTNVQPSSGGGGSYTAGDGIDIINDVISTKQSQQGDIDEIVDVYPQAGNLVSIVNAFNKSDIYSTEEKMIGQFVDGKPLYQKVFLMPTSFTMGSNTWYDTGIDGSYIEHTVSSKSNVYFDSYAVSFPVYSTVNNGTIRLLQTRNAEMMGVGGFTLQYTKIADTAISIGEETEYSTDEKVIGTWIDGKPIWQKTVFIGNLPNSDSKQVAHNIANIDRVVYTTASCQDSNNVAFSPPYVHPNNVATAVVVIVDLTDITVTCGTDRSGYDCYVTIQYTKTT